MEIKINSISPCSAFIDGKQYVTPFSLSTKPNYVGQLTVLPVNPDEYTAYSVSFTIEEDRLRSLSGGANGISWGAGLGEITLNPPRTQKNIIPEVISQQKSNGNQITLYYDGAPKIMCEGNSFFVKDLPPTLQNAKLKLSADGMLCAVTGNIQDKNYLLCIALDKGEWKVMHEITADTIETTDKGVISKNILPTMLRHEKKCTYKPFDVKPEEISFIPTVSHQYIEPLLPYLFLECVAIGSPDAINMLDNSLNIDSDGLEEFFGEFDTICPPPFEGYETDVVAIYNSKERIARPDLYKIEIEKGKITNIIHVLTCY